MGWKLQGWDECRDELEIAGVNWKLQGWDECRGELEIAGLGLKMSYMIDFCGRKEQTKINGYLAKLSRDFGLRRWVGSIHWRW